VCGIAGAWEWGAETPLWGREELLRGVGALRHRGPDGCGLWVDPQGSPLLAHARLSVIDLPTGAQPMGNEDGAVQVTFNGEIYNFRELREELSARGHTFRTRSDTEVLVHGYEEWGEGLVPRLEGMFAFALWDVRERRLLLARDRVGKKPLFLYRKGGRLAFASEMKALLALPGVDSEIDPLALPLYLAYGYVPTPRTFHRSIRKLPPATYVVVEAGDREPREVRYWQPDFRSVPIGRGEAREELRRLLDQAVARRLVADVPIGAFLSGGVDSSIIVGLMARHTPGRVRTFSMGFADDASYDEREHARLVARHFGTEHTEFQVEADSVGLIEELVALYDEPFGDSSAIPTWLVSRLTRGHVTVALSGDGGDELFAGYARFSGMRAAGALPSWMAALGGSAVARLPHRADFRHPLRRAERFFAAARLPPEERWLDWVGFFPRDPWGLLHPERQIEVDQALQELAEGDWPKGDPAEGACGGWVAGEGGAGETCRSALLLESLRGPWRESAGATTLGRSLALNFLTYLPEDLLVKADRNSMAHGLELRSPFLDRELVEFAAALPDRVRTPKGRSKGLLREAFADLLPAEILRRPKRGFAVPLPLWFRTSWRPYLEETLLAPSSRIGAWLDPEKVRGVAAEHLAGTRDRSQELWALLTFELWLRGREGGGSGPGRG